MAKRLARALAASMLVVLCTFAWLNHAYAVTNPNDQTLASPNYQFTESSLGNGGGQLQSSSANYVLGASVGDSAVGNSAGTNYQTNAGSNTTSDPALTFAITNGITSFGLFSPSATATATSTFSVIDYTSYGYAVFIMGNPPSNGSHTLPAMASTGVSTPGTEQFGINLVANTSPTSFGANFVQKPDSTFGFGTTNPTNCSKITAGYNTPNQFKFVSGDTIAGSCKSSGETDYTISYLINVQSLTPGGQYASNLQLICIATY